MIDQVIDDGKIKLPSCAHAIIQLLKNSNFMSTREMMDMLPQFSKQNICYAIRRLIEHNLIKNQLDLMDARKKQYALNWNTSQNITINSIQIRSKYQPNRYNNK